MNQKDVHLYVVDSLSDWEAGYAIAGINNPQFQKNPGRFRVRTVALSKALVTTIGGIRIKPDLQLADVSPQNSAMLILPGGSAWDKGKNIEIIETVHAILDSGKPVAAICGATAGLARVDLFDSV